MVKSELQSKVILFFIALFLFLPFVTEGGVAAAKTTQKVYDDAGLLTQEEIKALEEVANKYGTKRETEFIILTTNDTKGKSTEQYTEDIYDEKAFGYDKAHGNTVILTIDMNKGDLYVAGFYKAEKYLDNERLDLITDKIFTDISNGNYNTAFHTFLETSYKYMGIIAGVNPENILFKWWFQIIVSLGIAGLVVGTMAYNSGGKVTTNSRTYEDSKHTKVLARRDRYIRKSVTKRKKPSNKSSGRGSGGGGGVTRGGHSHSGSKRSF